MKTHTLRLSIWARKFGAFSLCSVDPASPALLTKDGPLKAYTLEIGSSNKATPNSITRLEFENSSRDNISPNYSNHHLYHMKLYIISQASAILREISEETSYQTVRLVFRTYSKVLRAICTSAPIRPSILISQDFSIPRNSSPSFGYNEMDYNVHIIFIMNQWSALFYQFFHVRFLFEICHL